MRVAAWCIDVDLNSRDRQAYSLPLHSHATHLPKYLVTFTRFGMGGTLQEIAGESSCLWGGWWNNPFHTLTRR